VQHAADALRFLAGDIAAVSVMPGTMHYFDNAAVAWSWHLKFASGAAGALVHNVRAGRAHERYRIFAENWTVTVSLASPMVFDERLFLEVESGGKLVERIGPESFPPEQRTAAWLQGYQGETEHFVECLERGRLPEPDVAEAVRSLELDDEMLRAKTAAAGA
jgi:predicted dehydrogenase